MLPLVRAGKLRALGITRAKRFALLPDVPAALEALLRRMLAMAWLNTGAHAKAAIKGSRLAYSPLSRDYVPFEVYDRYKLPAGAALAGPAIIEERESTTVIGEDATLRVEEHGFLFIEIKEAA